MPSGAVAMAYVVKTGLGFSDVENQKGCNDTGGSWSSGTCTYQHSSDSMTDMLRRGTCQGGGGLWSDSVGDGRDVCAYPYSSSTGTTSKPTVTYTQSPAAVVPTEKKNDESLLLVSSALFMIGGVLLLKAGQK